MELGGDLLDDDLYELSGENMTKMHDTIMNLTKHTKHYFKQMFLYLLLFLIFLMVLIFFFATFKTFSFYSPISFILGSCSAFTIAYLGGYLSCCFSERSSCAAQMGICETFTLVYKAGNLMAFFSASGSVVILTSLMLIYKSIAFKDLLSVTSDNHLAVSNYLLAFGFGTVTVALFFRLSGGVFSGCSDSDFDLMSQQNERPRDANALSYYQILSKNVNEICCTSVEVFSLISEVITVGLYLTSSSKEIIDNGTSYFPFLIITFGLCVSMLVALGVLMYTDKIEQQSHVEDILKYQILISSGLMLLISIIVSLYFFPSEYSIGTILSTRNVSNKLAMLCCILGILVPCANGFLLDYVVGKGNRPMKTLFEGTRVSPCLNVVYGISLGNLFSIIPVLLISFSILIVYHLAGDIGIILMALSILSILPSIISAEVVNLLSSQANGVSSISDFPQHVKQVQTDIVLGSERISTVGKGYIMCSIIFIGVSLMLEFISKVGALGMQINTPIVLTGILIGCMIPYAMSAHLLHYTGKQYEKNVLRFNLSIDVENNTYAESVVDDNKLQEAITFSFKTMSIYVLSVLSFILVFGMLLGTFFIGGLLAGNLLACILQILTNYTTALLWNKCRDVTQEEGIELCGRELYLSEKIDLIGHLKTLHTEKLTAEAERKVSIDEEMNDIKERIMHIDQAMTCLEKDEYHPENWKSSFVKNKDILFYKTSIKASLVGGLAADTMKSSIVPAMNTFLRFYCFVALTLAALFYKTSFFFPNK